jgi:Fur family transcriptional regulator, ferric uptake regulator
MSCMLLRGEAKPPRLANGLIVNGWAKMTEHVEILREAGLRVTQQRMSIIAILAEADDHPNADDVFAKARLLDDTVSVATVYRTLAVLESAGLIRKLSFEDAPARYEMMPQKDHDHLVDIDTGELIEIPSDEIDALRERIAKELGYEIISQHTILRGRRKA